MSAKWYTFDAYFKKRDKAHDVLEALRPLEQRDVSGSTAAFDALGASKVYADQGWENPHLEFLGIAANGKKLRAKFQAGTSCDDPHRLVRQVGKLGARFARVHVFNDQVGEGASLYFKKGKEVDLEDIQEDLADVDPSFQLEEAFDDDNPGAVLTLLRRGADPDMEVEDEPLVVTAMDYGWSDVALAVIEAGANLEVRDEEGNRPLHEAAMDAALEPGVIRAMVAHGADVDAKNDMGNTPLNELASMDEDDVLERALPLIEAGADVNACGDSGSVLWLARAASQVLARHLASLGAAAVPGDDDYGDDLASNLRTAIRHDDKVRFDALWAQFTPADVERKRLAELCVRYDRLACLREVAPDVVAFSNLDEGNRALSIAAAHNATEVFEYLLDGIGDPGALPCAQRAALDDSLVNLALHRHATPVLRRLLDGLVDPGVGRTGDEVTALRAAVEFGHLDNSRALLEAGADANAGSLLHAAAEAGHAALLRLLLEHGARVDARGPGGQTALHEAAGADDAVDAIAVLCTAGADVNAGNEIGATPLHIAAVDDAAIANARALLAAGADPEAEDEDGETPADYASNNEADAVLDLFGETRG